MFVWRLSRCLAPQEYTVHSNVTFNGSILSFLKQKVTKSQSKCCSWKAATSLGTREQRDGSRVVLWLVRHCFVIHLCVFQSTCVYFWWLILSPHMSRPCVAHRCQEATLVRELKLGEGRWGYCVFASSARFCVCARY